ncbi:LysR family transcriptional regulator [Streptomyces sp. UC4497]
MIDPRLRLVQFVARHGTVIAAAQALNYTPSTVSYQIRQLATDLGVELLHQQGRGVRLTPAAHTLLRHTEILQAQAERAYVELAAHTDEPTGQFTLCGFSTAATRLLPPAAASLQATYPRLTVQVIEAEPHQCFDLLLAGEADLALITATAKTPPISDTRFDQQPLLTDPLDLVVPTDHPFTKRTQVTLSDAAAESWIVGHPESSYHYLLLAACMAAGFTPHIAHYADQWDTGTALVAQHLGIYLVPRLARIDRDWPVARIRLHGEPAPARRILTATRRGARERPTTAHALNELVAIAADCLPPKEGAETR